VDLLTFIGIVALFSVLEAIARKGKARQGGEEEIPLPERPEAPLPRQRPPQPTGSFPRSYDEDPSFDETAERDETRLRLDQTTPVPLPAKGPRRSSGGSEDLIPAAVWDEIQRMARGEAPQKSQEAPTAQRRSARSLGHAPARGAEAPPPMEGSADHPIHRAHAAFGTSPTARAAPRAVGAPKHAPSPGAAVRKLLTPGGGSLRQAVILQEILGPPPGLRD
jgi:hypothetical protein